MSTQPPPTSAERMSARQNRSATVTKQWSVLGLGVAGAAVIAGVLGHVSDESNPIWVLAVIAPGFICFLGFLATTAWNMRAVMGQVPRPVVTGGIYLTSLLLVGGIVAYASDTPTLAHAIPLGLAVAVAALSVLGRIRRRARGARVERLRRGVHVVGTVTDDGLAEFADTPNIKLATVTVSFRDHSGNTRWVSVPAVQSPGRPISVGDQVDVWFDSAAPADTSKIVVEHDNGTSRITSGKVAG